MRHFRLNFEKCILLEVLAAVTIAAATALGQPALNSAVFAMSFIIAFGYAGIHLAKNPVPAAVAALIALPAFHVLFNCLMEEGNFSFAYFKKLIMFLTFVLILHFSNRFGNSVSPRILRLIRSLPVLAGLLLIVSYYILGNRTQYARGITLGFTNPNFTGMWLLHFWIYIFLYILECPRTSKLRLLLIPALVLMASMIIKTRARSCLLGLILYLLFNILALFHIRLSKKLLFAIAVSPLVFVFVYMGVVNTDWFQDMFSFMVSAGKGLDSRTYIWKGALESFWVYPITGNYAGISNGTGMSQMHNIHLDVLASYGILPCVLFIKLLYGCMKRAMYSAQTYSRYAALCGFIAVILIGTFEASIVAGSNGLNFLTAALLVLAQAAPEAIPGTPGKSSRPVLRCRLKSICLQTGRNVS